MRRCWNSCLIILFSLNLVPGIAATQNGVPNASFSSGIAQRLILIDVSRELSEDLSFELVTEILSNAGYNVEMITKTDELFGRLSTASVLMLPPCRNRLGSLEQRAILEFVEKGGGLLIVGEVRYEGYMELAKTFGITMLPGIVCDPHLSTPVKPFHIKIMNIRQHPVTENVDAFTYDWGQPLLVASPALSLATVGNGSWWETDANGVKDPDEQSGQFTVLASSEYGRGRVVATGDIGCFSLYRRLQWSPLQTYDTARLALNVFNWLAKSNLNGPSLEYTITITSNLAQRHIAHVDLDIHGCRLGELKLVLGRWQDGHYYYSGISNIVASSESRILNVSHIEERGTKLWFLKVDSENVTVRYDVAMDFIRRDFDAYGGYLGPKFGMCQAAQIFLVPANSFFSRIVVKSSLPSEWEMHGPWKQENGKLAPNSAKAAIVNYGLTLGMKEFLWAAIGFGKFAVHSRSIGQTEVNIACWAGWDQPIRESIWKSSFDLYEYMTSLFGRSAPLERYLAIWAPPAEDGRGVCEIEWSSSQGLDADPPRYYAFGNYAHRLFHIWNAFEPTGMRSDTSSERWVSEGMNVYYNSKALAELGLLNRDRVARSEYEWYVREIVGTKYDVSLMEAGNYGSWQNFDQYIWLYYRKGALVWYIFDGAIQTVTGGSRSLDDLQKLMYNLYGGHRGSYSTKDVQKHLETIAGISFESLFQNYVYGTTRLPLFIDGNRVAINYTALGLTATPTSTATQIRTTSSSSSTLVTKTTTIETKKEPELPMPTILAIGLLIAAAIAAAVEAKRLRSAPAGIRRALREEKTGNR
jgi:predicted metalloprotease with PDZ domain